MTAAQLADPVAAIVPNAGEIRFYQRYGFLLIPGLIAEDEAATLRDEVMGIMRQIGGFEGSKLRQTHQYLAGSRLDAFVNSPNLLRIAAALMGGASTLYLPFTAVKGSGGGTFHFHQDNNYTRFDGPGINLWTALTPMSTDNGCLNVVPESHRDGDLASRQSDDGDTHRQVAIEPEDFLPVRMRPGDCVAFSRLTVHGSGPNRTPDPRVAYAVQFFRDDVRFTPKGQPDATPLPLKTHSPQRDLVEPVTRLTVPKGKVDGH